MANPNDSAITLDADNILLAAGVSTGYFNLLDDGFRARLGHFVDWLNEHGNLSAEQALEARKQIILIVITRLQLAADRERISGIAQEVVEKPIFVIGYSRTGTTLLHSLMTADPAHQAAAWWQTHQPSPPPGEMPVAKARRDAAQWEIDGYVRYTPGIMTVHPYWDEGVDTLIEDEEIHTIDFGNLYPTLLYRIPALALMNLGDTADARGCYAFQKQFMQHQQWNLPKRRWVMKGCAHQFQLKELFEEFPDAICIWPHRDPVEVHRSTLAIASVLYHAVTNGRIDWKQFGTEYIRGTRAGIDRVMADPLVDDPRIIHLRFKELAKDPLGTLENIYQRASLPYAAEIERAMRAWLEAPTHRSDRYGRYPYALELYGLKAADVAATFADYSARFGV